MKPALPPLPFVEPELVEGVTAGLATALAVAPRLERKVGSVPGIGSYSPAGSESSRAAKARGFSEWIRLRGETRSDAPIVPFQHQRPKQSRQTWLRSWPLRATARSASAQARQVDQPSTVSLSVMERTAAEEEASVSHGLVTRTGHSSQEGLTVHEYRVDLFLLPLELVGRDVAKRRPGVVRDIDDERRRRVGPGVGVAAKESRPRVQAQVDPRVCVGRHLREERVDAELIGERLKPPVGRRRSRAVRPRVGRVGRVVERQDRVDASDRDEQGLAAGREAAERSGSRAKASGWPQAQKGTS